MSRHRRRRRQIARRLAPGARSAAGNHPIDQAGSNACTELYGRVFRPTVHKEIYAFEDLPRALSEMHHNVQTGIPIVRVAKEMPARVQSLVR